MPPFLQFVIRRFLVIPVSLLIITLVGFSPVPLAVMLFGIAWNMLADGLSEFFDLRVL